MAGIWNIPEDEPQGLLGGFQRGLTNPLTLSGLGLLSGEGFGGAMQGARMGMAFDEQRRQLAQQAQQKQQFEGLLSNVNVPKDVLAIARMQGPQAGAATLAQYVDPARNAELELKKAQIAKLNRDNALATQEATRKKALYDSFMTPAAAPASTGDLASPVARFAAPGLTGQGEPQPKQPQTPREIFDALPAHRKAEAQIALQRGDTEAFAKIIGEGPARLADDLTPGEKRVDQTFAKSYEDYVLSGGAADFNKNLEQLRGVQKEMTAKDGANLTGPILGRMPDAITAFTNPKAVDARQRVEEIVQRNLRIVLGAQFTQKEGENLIARAYNPALDEATNAKRLGRLITSMEKMAKAKTAASDYFERHGTMKGFRGTTQFSVNDLLADIDAPDQPSAPGGTTGFKYIGAAD